MNTHSCCSRDYRSPIPCRAAVLLVALAWSSLVFGGEIHEAAKAGDLKKVKALLKDNPELVFSKDTNGITPLYWAADRGNKDVVELLLANKADVNAEVKADVNAKKNGGWTLFIAAAATNGQKDTAEVVLANKAEAEVKATADSTPLHAAASIGHKDVAELLLANKADVNAKTVDGETPLHRAAAEGDKDVVELLLASKAEVNAKANDGSTPLHAASAHDDHRDRSE